MKVTSGVSGTTRPVISIQPSFYTCLRIEGDTLYEHPDFPHIHVEKAGAEIIYEVGDEVVIVKDWPGYPTTVPSCVGLPAVITNVFSFQQVVCKVADKEWVYNTANIAPLVLGEGGLTKVVERKKPRVINPPQQHA